MPNNEWIKKKQISIEKKEILNNKRNNAIGVQQNIIYDKCDMTNRCDTKRSVYFLQVKCG